MNNPYTIITIGPIYDTFMLADKTRAFWGASALFSMLSNKMLGSLLDKYKESIIVPHIDDKKFLKQKHKAGLLDDRIIMQGAHADTLQTAFNDAVDALVDKIMDSLEVNESEKKECEKYFKEYFHSYIIEADVPNGGNPILYISQFADSAEYQPRFGKYLGKHYMQYYFDRVNRNLIKKEFFTNEEIKDITKDRRFKSTTEIAANDLMQIGVKGKEWSRWQELFGNYADVDDTKIYTLLKEDFNEKLKPYHKYYALVQSDGDGFGAYIREIGANKEKLKALSKNLFDYLKASVKYIREQGGMVVYAGGDDLLFFAPIIYNKKNIFGFITELDNIFNEHFSVEKDEDYKKLSISYGMSITHYKSPLYESLEVARHQLVNVAKNAKWHNGSQKNALAVSLAKHSGGTTHLLLDKSTETYKKFVDFVNEELDSNSAIAIPHSFYDKVQKFKVKFENAQAHVQIDHFYINEFGLQKDTTPAGAKKAMAESREILKCMLFDKECLPSSGDIDATDVLFSMLKSTKLLRGDE